MDHDRKRPFRVIVVGGGIAGLALSLCLSKAGVDHVVIEAYPEIASPRGASIGFWPHGMKILSQIGCFEDIKKQSVPMEYSYDRLPSGKPASAGRLWDFIEARHGYEFRALERRKALGILYGAIPDKSRILTGKRVSSVVETVDGVRVILKDGSFEEGDIAIGCDGAHSVVRDAMWNAADTVSPGLITRSEKDSMTTEYTCLIGMASNVPGLEHSPDMHVTYGNQSTIQIVLQPDSTFFLVYRKLARPIRGSKRINYTQEDADKEGAVFADFHVTENVLFRDIYKRRVRSQLVNLEEVVFDHWHHGRLAILGDAAHKVTPNFAFGGNCALEGVAVFTNALNKALSNSPNRQLSQPGISAMFEEYQNTQKTRVKKIYNVCWYVTRMQAWDGTVMKFIARYIAPWLGDERLADFCATIVKSGNKLDFLPVPEHPAGTYTWDHDNPGKGNSIFSSIGWPQLSRLIGTSA